MSMLELYHNNISVCAQKVRVVLAEKNLPWTSHHLSFVRGEHLTPSRSGGSNGTKSGSVNTHLTKAAIDLRLNRLSEPILSAFGP
jgi:hypothetical protein